MKYDVIIIGSGLGGLECAHILSRAGKSVLLLEQAKHAGGCMQSYVRHGQAFDTGFHYVGGLDEGQSLHAAFKLLGLLKLPWHRLDEQFEHILIGDRSFAFAQGYKAFVETLATAFPAERRSLELYADMLKNSLRQQFALLNPHLENPDGLLPDVEKNAWQYLQETFRDPLLINVLSATSLKMELRKSSLPLFTFAHGNSSFIESSWRLKGDGSLIVNSLLDDIRAWGGEIRCNARVDELVEKDGRIVLARCSDGEVYEGDVFVSDIYPATTCSLVKESSRLKNIYRKRLNGLQNTYGMFTVSLSVKPGVLPYFNWNQYIYKHPDVWDFYEREKPVSGLLACCRVPEDGSGYVRQIDLLTPMKWEQCERWKDTRVGHRGEDYEAMKQRKADECLTLAERAFPGLRAAVSGYYVSSPLTYRDYLLSPDGSAYGVRKDCGNPMMTLLSVRTPLPNLLLTGQSLMLHGVHGVTMTSLFTCAEIMGKEYIWNRLLNQ